MFQFILYKKRKSRLDDKWVPITKGKIDFVLFTLELNLIKPELNDFEFKVARAD